MSYSGDPSLGLEVHHQGWLIKSPPLERTSHNLIKARWRRRWFVLQEKSGQHVLNYFTDEKSFGQGKKPKGTIFLEECEQVDCGLTVENGKQRYDFMFDIKTPGRVYYLAAESYEEMSSWVRLVCAACGLKASQEEENDNDAGFIASEISERKPNQPAEKVTTNNNNDNSEVSGPYIHISSCYTGGHPPTRDRKRSNPSTSTDTTKRTNDFELSNYDLGDDSVFLPPTQTSVGSQHEEQNLAQRLKEQSLGAPTILQPPDRPPKPPHLSNKVVRNAPIHGQRDNYANSNDMENVYKGEQTSNAASQTAVSSIVPYPPSVTPLILSNNSNNSETINKVDGKNRGPNVSRELKPGRGKFGHKSATMGANLYNNKRRNHAATTHVFDARNNPLHFATLAGPGGRHAPPVPRAMKPKNFALSEMDLSKVYRPNGFSSSTAAHSADFSSGEDEGTSTNSFEDHSENMRRPSYPEQEEQIYFYMPSLESSGNGKFPTMIPADNFEHPSIAYIDLDLPPPSSASLVESGTNHFFGGNDLLHFPEQRQGGGHSNTFFDGRSTLRKDSVERNNDSVTAYKKIDFVKTEAFNRTRHKVEEKYNKENN